jgi:hypothetical protein
MPCIMWFIHVVLFVIDCATQYDGGPDKTNKSFIEFVFIRSQSEFLPKLWLFSLHFSLTVIYVETFLTNKLLGIIYFSIVFYIYMCSFLPFLYIKIKIKRNRLKAYLEKKLKKQ